MGEESKDPGRDASGRSPQESDAPPPDESEEGRPDESEEETPDESEEGVEEVGSGERPQEESPIERVERFARGDLKEGEWVEDISSTVAPSVGPKSVLFHHPAESPDHDVSLDAMGNDKRRQVVGHSYGPSFARQAIIYGIFVALVIALFIGGKIAIDHFDKAPAHNKDQAPWSAPNATQHTPQQFVDVGSSKPEVSKPVKTH